MIHLIQRKDYWFVAGIIALSIALKICAIVALSTHVVNRTISTPYIYDPYTTIISQTHTF